VLANPVIRIVDLGSDHYTTHIDKDPQPHPLYRVPHHTVRPNPPPDPSPDQPAAPT